MSGCSPVSHLETECVSLPDAVPKQDNPNQIFLVGDGFGLFLYLKAYD